MASIYDSYASQTGAVLLDHKADIRRVADHFRKYLLPVLPNGVNIDNCSIFEFGAGWGRNLLALGELGASNIQGIDISEEQVAIGRGLGLDKLKLESLGNMAENLTNGAQFDIVLAIDVLEHLDLDDLYSFSRLVQGFMAPNGLLVVQVPNALAPFNPVVAGDLTHQRGFTLASLRQLLLLAGTEPLHLAGVPFPGSGILRAVRLFAGRRLIMPGARVLSWILYGRSQDMMMVEPNLLGIGRARRDLQQ